MRGSCQPAAGADLVAPSVVRSRHQPQPRISVYPHVYPPKALIRGTQHPCAFPADLAEQVQNLE